MYKTFVLDLASLLFALSCFAVRGITVKIKQKEPTTENTESSLWHPNTPKRQIQCNHPEYLCRDNKSCYNLQQDICNGKSDCKDGSDESDCKITEQEFEKNRKRWRKKDNFPVFFKKLVIGVIVMLVLLGVLACVCQFQKYSLRSRSDHSDSLDSVSSMSGAQQNNERTANNICLHDFGSHTCQDELSTLTSLDPCPPAGDAAAGYSNSADLSPAQASAPPLLEYVSWAEVHSPPSGNMPLQQIDSWKLPPPAYADVVTGKWKHSDKP